MTVECLRGNNRAMTTALASNNFTPIKNQIESDLRVITTMPYASGQMGDCSLGKDGICASAKLNSKTGVQNCLACMARATSLIEEYQIKSTTSTKSGGGEW
jgi:hypothetical protein